MKRRGNIMQRGQFLWGCEGEWFPGFKDVVGAKAREQGQKGLIVKGGAGWFASRGWG